jgi:NAD(P)-dependent dehydrogenase (short-subunit alcohol dehydrogenase family)
MGKLDGQITLVVGGGRGLGRATALVFAKEGSNVVVAARTEAEIKEVAEEVRKYGRDSVAVVTDATKRSQVENLVNQTVEKFGRIDNLVNCQGDWLIKPTLETTEKDWDHLFDANLKSVYFTCKAVLPHMIEQGSGHIFNISSQAGLWYPGGGIISLYKASKLGLVGFSKALASEFQSKGVGVHVICPAPMDTPMRWEATPSARKEALLRPETVADIMVMIASHPDLKLDEVIVPDIRLPHTTAYNRR